MDGRSVKSKNIIEWLEATARYRVDLMEGLARLDGSDRELLINRYERGQPSNVFAVLAGLRLRELDVVVDGAVQGLTNAMNNGGEGVATKVSVNGSHQTEELERLHQAIARKLAHLPPG